MASACVSESKGVVGHFVESSFNQVSSFQNLEFVYIATVTDNIACYKLCVTFTNNKTTLVLAKSRATDLDPVIGITSANKFVEYAFSEVSKKS